jgi:hypothetical protein
MEIKGGIESMQQLLQQITMAEQVEQRHGTHEGLGVREESEPLQAGVESKFNLDSNNNHTNLGGGNGAAGRAAVAGNAGQDAVLPMATNQNTDQHWSKSLQRWILSNEDPELLFDVLGESFSSSSPLPLSLPSLLASPRLD